jgi:hypothetical protein
MKLSRQNKVSLGKQLGILAMQFRGTKVEAERASIAEAYAQTVSQLIESGTWRKIPPLEDQLPDDQMPQAFFEFWELR